MAYLNSMDAKTHLLQDLQSSLTATAASYVCLVEAPKQMMMLPTNLNIYLTKVHAVLQVNAGLMHRGMCQQKNVMSGHHLLAR